ncbi:MAG TPA: alpha-mannosidase [Tepidisphaeraceae bacterium]|jgi:alpha-mannosidase
MQKYESYTRDRLRQLSERMSQKIYSRRVPAQQILTAPAPDRISYAQAQKLKSWQPAKVGESFGPPWSTHWFKLRFRVPADFKNQRVDLLWNSHSEATLWIDGKSVQGLNAEPGPGWQARKDAILLDKAKGGETLNIQIEMACNSLFGVGDAKMQNYPSLIPWLLEEADIAIFDSLAWDLYQDFSFLFGLYEDGQKNKDLDAAWQGLLLAELNRFANEMDEADRTTWQPAGKILKALYQHHNGDVVHNLSAIGHAHIDTAWLWPLAETHRKCERTFSTQTTYMRDYPDYKFSCSQAYQYQVIMDRNPDLYQRIKKFAKKGQWVPVGGTWIEPDCNIPSGESLIRQFLFGQRFFEKEFGARCKEFWNPDVFGYNGQLPQICNLMDIKRFLTQKLSWNRFNRPDHHTFIWEGIDGSEVFTHFPPADTYNAVVSIEELRRNVRNYKDNDRSRHSYMLFGYGDGGGGPTKEMLEHIERAKDLPGLPKTEFRSSDEFFTLLEKDNTDRVRLVGELYFEYHRGTYTSQAANKKGNRKSEFFMHDVEFLSVLASKTANHKYPAQEINDIWKLILLNQFHDILPGSSINQVYVDSAAHYNEIAERAQTLRDHALKSLVSKPGGSTSASGEHGRAVPLQNIVAINTIGFPRTEIVQSPDGKLLCADAPSYGIGKIIEATDSVSIEERKGRVVLENTYLRAELSSDGTVLSLVEKSTGREALAGNANSIRIYDDQNTAWDAWDVDPFHIETEKESPAAHVMRIITRSPLRAEVEFQRKISSVSSMRQVIRLDAHSRRLEFHTEVDWHENRKMLKAVFPVNVRAMNATYEMQFGCVERPTHFNTSYDLARYEVPGHKWADLSEFDFGITLLSESKYGFSTFANQMRISLLRSSKHPDENADMGKHSFAYAIMPHAGDWRDAGVVAEGFRFNAPMILASGSATPGSIASVDRPNLVLDTIKKAEDSDAVILRLYEAHGGRGTANVKCNLPFKSAVFCNGLEEEIGTAKSRNGAIEIPFTPFQIVTLKLK